MHPKLYTYKPLLYSYAINNPNHNPTPRSKRAMQEKAPDASEEGDEGDEGDEGEEEEGAAAASKAAAGAAKAGGGGAGGGSIPPSSSSSSNIVAGSSSSASAPPFTLAHIHALCRYTGLAALHRLLYSQVPLTLILFHNPRRTFNPHRIPPLPLPLSLPLPLPPTLDSGDIPWGLARLQGRASGRWFLLRTVTGFFQGTTARQP